MPDNLDPVVDNQDPEVTPVVKDWREGLDPSIREHPSLKNFKNEGDLAQSWVSAQKLIGRDKIPVPGEKATKEDWDTVFERLGRPKDVNGYTLPEIKLPEGYPPADERFMNDFKGKALELGMLPAQVNGLYEWFMGEQVSQFNQFGQQRETAKGEAENALRKVWGKAFEQNFALAENAVNKYGTDTFVAKLKASGLNNDPDMVKFIADMAQNFSEDKIAGGRGRGLTLSPEEAKAEINKIQAEAMKDKHHPMNNKHHPEHQMFLDKWRALHEQAYIDENV